MLGMDRTGKMNMNILRGISKIHIKTILINTSIVTKISYALEDYTTSG